MNYEFLEFLGALLLGGSGVALGLWIINGVSHGCRNKAYFNPFDKRQEFSGEELKVALKFFFGLGVFFIVLGGMLLLMLANYDWDAHGVP